MEAPNPAAPQPLVSAIDSPDARLNIICILAAAFAWVVSIPFLLGPLPMVALLLMAAYYGYALYVAFGLYCTGLVCRTRKASAAAFSLALGFIIGAVLLRVLPDLLIAVFMPGLDLGN